MMTDKLVVDEGMEFQVAKTYTHSQGLSCCFRQWRAKDTHCRFLHGYAIQVTIVFGSKELDDRNWVYNFGGLKPLKQWLEDTFDHKTLIASDDPNLESFRTIAHFRDPLIQLVEVDHVGCEAFAKMIYNHIDRWIIPQDDSVWVESVEVREHESNAAIYRRKR